MVKSMIINYIMLLIYLSIAAELKKGNLQSKYIVYVRNSPYIIIEPVEPERKRRLDNW